MKVTIRADSVEIEGYVNAVGRDSRKLTDEYGYPFIEQIEPGTFARAISDAETQGREIEMLLDHDPTHKIGGTADNLELKEDSIGLHARATVTDPETVNAAREKRLRGWSFGFRGLDYKEEYAGDCYRRKITEMELIEVSAIDERMTPAYAGTSVHARADDGKQTVYVRAIDDTVEYDESCTGATEPEAEEEVGQQVPEEAPEETRADIIEDETRDYSIYRNKITLLQLKG